MSIAFVKTALQRFLSDPESTPEVLCIKGNWGVGKTHAWKDAVQEAVAKKTLKMTKYAYISLFGIKDSSDIMQSVFAAAYNPYFPDNKQTLPEALGGHNLGEIAKRIKSVISFTAEHTTVPYIAGLGGVVRAVLSSLVGDTLVCIDDFERRGPTVSVNEVMGVIAQLRDARRCRVVLILNEDSLDEKEKAEFQRYSEKVINRTIRFLPTETEVAAIAFPDNDLLGKYLRINCEKLGIINIRIMFRLRLIAADLLEIIKTTEEDIRNAVLKSLVVLVWAALSPPGEGAPTMAYLTNKREAQYMGGDGAKYSPEEDQWNVLLNDYGFSHCDELDLLMISGIEHGFFNNEKIVIEIEKLLKGTAKIRGDAALTAAWAPFHSSFDNNPDDVAKSIYDGCSANILCLSPLNLSGAVDILKTIGHTDEAFDLLKSYIKERGDEDIFDLSNDPFGGDVTDPDVISAFAKKAAETVDRAPLPVEAASRVSTGGWGPKDEETLATLSVDDFVAEFKSAKGKDRRTLIFGSLQFLKIANATKQQISIGRNAQAALIKIGQESPLNARRLRAYGISAQS